ncbi:hypothetical protein AM1_4209 [Acaryochloris marina MBIC11017]|uniref:Uncharacterized protein n=1 Tax=Acaryochloris marina (strain MBIC 11017) TaxID=329726 RepID=B0CCM7_ACAM1|nr:hypothetical protein AM1_4209 [Acaryochloris marina MBIC11017]
MHPSPQFQGFPAQGWSDFILIAEVRMNYLVSKIEMAEDTTV